MLNKIFPLLRNAALLAAYFISSAFINISTRDPLNLRRRQVAQMSRFALAFRKALNISVRVIGAESLEALRSTHYLLVANHVSYLDVIVLGSLERLAFITSVEMGENSIMGPITRNGGCLFTDRRKFVSLPAEIERFSQCLASGFKVGLFPEGTSTNGNTVRDFRGSLFQVAIGAQAPVLPVCLRYLSIDGQPVTVQNHATICWYGDMTFAPHFWKLLGHRLEVEVNVLPLINYDPRRSRAALSQLTHSVIHQCYHSYPPIDPAFPIADQIPSKEL